MKMFATLAFLSMAICYASDASCPSGDESCALDNDEVSMLALHQAKQKGHVVGHVTESDPEEVGTSTYTGGDDPSQAEAHAEPHAAEVGTSELQLHGRALSQTNLDERLRSLVGKHFSPPEAAQELLRKKPLSAQHALQVAELLESNATTTGTMCPRKYTNQYFKPRLNLCDSSFTGLDSCTERGCYLLASFFYSSNCHVVYYSNAESQANGYGMCRCWPISVNDVSRYSSSSGNNIYSCSSIMR